MDSVFDGLIDFVYSKTGGLNLQGMILVAVVAAGLRWSGSYVVQGRVKKARKGTSISRWPSGRARRQPWMVGIALALLILPFFTGSIVNELLANVSIFLLLALGLNIVVGLAGILDLGYVAFFAVGGYDRRVDLCRSWRILAELGAVVRHEGEPVLVAG